MFFIMIIYLTLTKLIVNYL